MASAIALCPQKLMLVSYCMRKVSNLHSIHKEWDVFVKYITYWI